MRHCSASATLPQMLQKRILSLTSTSALTSRFTSTASACSRWNAMRCAPLGPTPGKRPSSSIRSWTTPSYTSVSLCPGPGPPIRRRTPNGADLAYWSSSPITVPPRTRAMTGWPTAPASSMSSSSGLTTLSSATDDELLVCRVLASWATAALARCLGVG